MNNKPVNEWNKEEVYEFAISGNHKTLYSYLHIFKYNDDVSWESAMQACAVHLSEELKEAHNYIAKLMMERR